MATLNVDIVSSVEEIFSGEVEYLVATAIDGEIGIYPNHTPYLCQLKPGLVRLKRTYSDITEVFAVSGGFLEVKDNKATILADTLIRTDDLDEVSLLQEKTKSEEYLSKVENIHDESSAKAYAKLSIVIAQLKAVEFLRNRH